MMTIRRRRRRRRTGQSDRCQESMQRMPEQRERLGDDDDDDDDNDNDNKEDRMGREGRGQNSSIPPTRNLWLLGVCAMERVLSCLFRSRAVIDSQGVDADADVIIKGIAK